MRLWDKTKHNMTPTSPIIDMIVSLFPWGFIKIGLLILLFLYFVFSAVVLRQVTLMSRVIEVRSSPVLHILALSHLLFVVVVFFLSLLLL